MPKPLVFSYTFLNTYLICPHQAYHRYVLRDVPFTETREIAHGNRVHGAMEQRVAGGKPLPADLRDHESFACVFDGRHAQVELKLGIDAGGKPVDYWAGNVKLRGKIDCVVLNGTRAHLTDWKTGKPREDPFELEIGALLLHARHLNLLQITGNYAWLRESRVGQLHDLSDTKATWLRVNRIIYEVESDRTFEKKQTPLCGWCPVKSCEFNRADARKSREEQNPAVAAR